MVKKGGKFMNDSWNNVKTVCCKPWLVLPTVYSDALSYGEQLDKFCYSLNKLIENNNILPDFIADKIKEYISSGAIGEVVQEILANYILNVKYPPKGITPAVGDGSADDTEALQGCIDYASENGGVVYFPYGSYLTQPLTVKSGVSLFGFDRYSTKVVLKGGATKALLNGNGNNFSVCNLTLDGNSGIQVNDVNVVDMTGSNLLFNDLIIKDGYRLFNFVGDGHLQLNNIVFGNAVENCFTVDGNVIVQTNNLLFTALSKVGGVSVVDIRANGGNYDFNSVAKCDTCILISGNDNKVVAMIGGAAEDYVDTGEHNNVEIVGHSQKEYYSGDVKKDANNSETTLQGTRSLHVVGASTFAVDGNSTESVDGNKSEIVTGVTSETYKNTKTTNLTNENKNLTGKENLTTNELEENINGNKTTTANNIIENITKNKTVIADTITEETTKNNNFKANDVIFNTPRRTISINDLQREITRTIFDFGAKGDGITDDSEAFQNAYNAGGIIDVPGKTYYCTKAITITPGKNVIFNFLGDVIFNNISAIELPPLNDGYGTTIYESTPDSQTPYHKYNYGVYTMTDGTKGNVQSNDVAKASLRSNSNNYIWTRLSILSVDEPVISNAENVASYSQINGRADSDTGMWGACVEINDPHNNPTQPKTGLEITYRGGEADGNKVRHALHISHLVSEGASGSQVDSAIFVSGAGNVEESPMANFNSLMRIQSCNFVTLLEGNRKPDELPPKCDYGFDFTNIITKYSVLKCAQYPIQFNTLFLQEVNGNLNLSGGAHLFSLYPTVSPYEVRQTETYTYLPLDIDGERYLIPLFKPTA